MSLPRYSQYKDSGAAIVGAVPHHWQMKPVKAIASINDDVLTETTEPTYELTYVDIGSVSLGSGIESTATFTFKDAPSRARRLVRDGDVIISTVRTYLKAIASIVEPPENLVVSTGFAVVRPLDTITPGFAKYALQSPAFVDAVISRSTGVSYPAINASDLARIALPVPPRDEQSSIAAFLDREISKIDALIAEQERLLELLAEKRQAAISHAVTRGLNTDVPLKDSGVASLGRIPLHWTAKQLRHIAKIVRGASPRPAGDPRFFSNENDGDGYLPWVTVAEVTKDDAYFLETVSEYLTPDGVQNSQKFKSGTVVFTNSGATLGVPKVLKIDCCANDGILAFKNLSQDVEPLFLYMFLSTTTERLRTEMKQGGGQPNLNTDIVKGIGFAQPPIHEQRAIVNRIQAELKRLDSLKIQALHAIELLLERRSALISAAVTGKIDVREHTSALAAAA